MYLSKSAVMWIATDMYLSRPIAWIALIWLPSRSVVRGVVLKTFNRSGRSVEFTVVSHPFLAKMLKQLHYVKAQENTSAHPQEVQMFLGHLRSLKCEMILSTSYYCDYIIIHSSCVITIFC